MMNARRRCAVRWACRCQHVGVARPLTHEGGESARPRLHVHGCNGPRDATVPRRGRIVQRGPAFKAASLQLGSHCRFGLLAAGDIGGTVGTWCHRTLH